MNPILENCIRDFFQNYIDMDTFAINHQFCVTLMTGVLNENEISTLRVNYCVNNYIMMKHEAIKGPLN